MAREVEGPVDGQANVLILDGTGVSRKRFSFHDQAPVIRALHYGSSRGLVRKPQAHAG